MNRHSPLLSHTFVFSAIAVTLVCALPWCLHYLLGIDFSNPALALDTEAWSGLSEEEASEVVFFQLSGTFVHTLLEWTAFSVAVFTVFLGFSHFFSTGNVTTFVVCIALFFAGCMDAFHTLVADRLIHGVADPTDVVAFTWAVCRVFNALILMGGIVILLYFRFDKVTPSRRLMSLLFVTVFFGVTAYVLIWYMAHSPHLPQTQFPNSVITRPYDVVPLVLFLFCGVFLFPLYYQKFPSIFAQSLILATIPDIAVELHMAFGSSRLFDSHFNIAHGLKIVAYLMPMFGLLFDYISTQHKQQVLIEEMQEVSADLRLKNHELEIFNHAASHHFQEPLRSISIYSQYLKEDLPSELPPRAMQDLEFIVANTAQMRRLVQDLRVHGDFISLRAKLTAVPLGDVLEDVLEALQEKIAQTKAKINIEALPEVYVDRYMLYQVFIRLIDNALIYSESTPEIHVSCLQEHNDSYDIAVKDNGVGIPAHQYDFVFQKFTRLHSRDDAPGSGMGLAAVKLLLSRIHGGILLSSTIGEGSVFIVTLPKP